MPAQAKPRSPKKPSRHPSGPAEFAPGVFVGGWKDAVAFDGDRFCVLDEPPEGLPGVTHVPIYDEATDRPLRTNLDRLATLMAQARASGRPVLVFCGHGVRRSPLAAAWFLHRTAALDLPSAYAQVRRVRPQLETADEWIGDVSSLGAR